MIKSFKSVRNEDAKCGQTKILADKDGLLFEVFHSSTDH